MSKQQIKIAVLGDYNFTYNTHLATNLALDHASNFLEIDTNYYWLKFEEISNFNKVDFNQFDGFWISPAPYKDPLFLNVIIKQLMEIDKTVIITGEAYKYFFEVLINKYDINNHKEKFISENLVSGNQFEKVEVFPLSQSLKKLYENHNTIELTSSRFSLYPSIKNILNEKIIDIEGTNQFGDPEIVSLKLHKFYLATAFCPQISSTKEIPHPLIYTFLKASMIN